MEIAGTWLVTNRHVALPKINDREANFDVAVIEVGDLLIEQRKTGISLMSYVGLTSDHLPENSKLTINVGDEILVAGYPRGFYDVENKFPIVKAGIVSSKWGCNFNGQPVFLIDAKLFPGSSGSVVLTKPQYVAVIDEKLMYNKEGSYIFLGIYSGEPIRQNAPIELDDMTIIKKDSYNVGNVWYSSLVPEIIADGIKII